MVSIRHAAFLGSRHEETGRRQEKREELDMMVRQSERSRSSENACAQRPLRIYVCSSEYDQIGWSGYSQQWNSNGATLHRSDTSYGTSKCVPAS